MKNNKKGFTLIELLVTVALLVSVLTIVIISVTNVSEKQKENAYVKVKDQVMTAAEQYFSTNEYYFEGMANGSIASITVGKLVEDGFLNTLTNPVTGKLLDECSYVKVTKTDGKYDIEFIENTSENCDDKYLVSVSEPKSTSFSTTATTTKTTTVTTTKKTTTTTTTKKITTTSDTLAPKVTLKVYKRKEDGSNGTLIHEGVYQGTDKNNNSVAINNSKWMNKAGFPYGVNIVYSANEALSSAIWYWNKAGLTKTEAKDSSNTWNNSKENCYGNYCNNKDDTKTLSSKGSASHEFAGDGARRGRIYVEDAKGNKTRIYISAYFDKKVDSPKINLSSAKETAKDVTFTLTKPNNDISGISKVQYSYDKKNWSNYSSKTTLLKTTGTKKVYARTIDEAGNISDVVDATGKCDKDGVDVDFAGDGMPFTLPISLKYPDSVSGITKDKYEYYYWGAESTSDDTDAADAGGRADKLTKCENSFNEIKNTYKAQITKNSKVTLYAKAKKQYYCFAVRPYRETEISGINRWTIQGKHSEFSGNITSSNYNGVDTTAGNYSKK